MTDKESRGFIRYNESERSGFERRKEGEREEGERNIVKSKNAKESPHGTGIIGRGNRMRLLSSETSVGAQVTRISPPL